MNTELANILKGRIEPLPFVDTIAGLVEVGEKSHNKKAIRFPISRDVTHVDCNSGTYEDLTPNDKKKSVIWFEDGGVRQTGKEGKRIKYASTFTMVGWLNLKKIGVTGFNTSSLAVASIIKALDGTSFNSGVFTRVKIDVLGQLPKDKAIFNKYTFRDEAKYLMFPFDFFALRLEVTYELNAQCINDFVLGTEDECLDC